MTAHRYLAGAAALAGLVVAGTIVATTASAQTRPTAAAGPVARLAREPAAADFAAAAREFAVPEPLLLAYSYALTGWQDHAGLPSAQGGYGPMHLTSAEAVEASGRGGARSEVAAARLRTDPARNTLARAATLVGQPASRLRTDLTQNVRGGAALLADEARHAGIPPATLADWYPVVVRLSGGSGTSTLADDIFDMLRTGAADAQLRLAAQPGIAVPRRAAAAADQAECPADLACTFVPAAYAWNNTADANDYGNYDPANRPTDGNRVRYIVIHDTEGSFDGTVQWFQNPAAYTSAHYVIRSSDGAVTQMVHTKDVAWHAGNWNVNAESIGIEHEGVAVDGATWYTDAMYRSSAKLVRYLANRYHIPIDRQHILGHEDVAGDGNYANSHWDPGPFWDWDRYLSLLHGAAEPQTAGNLVVVKPKFSTNRPPLRYCTSTGCRDLPAQPTNAVLLRTAPRDDAPLLPDPLLVGGGGTNDAADWSDKAVTGRRYVVAARKGHWTAIWYGGQQAWLHTADLCAVRGTTVKPKAGLQVPVFAAALPEPSEWPPGTPAGQPSTPPTMKPLYTISGEQRYQLADTQRAEYYYARFDGANVPLNHTIVIGAQSYYRISFNHRYLYVRTGDVTLG